MQYDASVVPVVVENKPTTTAELVATPLPPAVLDKEAYDKKLIMLANNGLLQILLATSTLVEVSSSTASTTNLVLKEIIPPTASELVSSTKKIWPAKAVYPNVGALLPFNRIVAYYGNFYSTKMGALGEYPADEMIERLQREVLILLKN